VNGAAANGAAVANVAAGNVGVGNVAAGDVGVGNVAVSNDGAVGSAVVPGIDSAVDTTNPAPHVVGHRDGGPAGIGGGDQ
jgi:hypothetical protein